MRLLAPIVAVALAAVLVPFTALAAGGHDSIGCSGCHSLHAAKGAASFAVAPNTKYLNPKTNKPYQGITALCLACHQDSDKGGQGYAPISQHVSHPFDLDQVNPKVARVPAEMLHNGRFECMGCHDPHPANANYKYLRVDTSGGKNIDRFCGTCHASKADAGALTEKAVQTVPAAKAPAKKK